MTFNKYFLSCKKIELYPENFRSILFLLSFLLVISLISRKISREDSRHSFVRIGLFEYIRKLSVV